MNDKTQTPKQERFNLNDWVNSSPAAYDRKAVYDEHIRPLIEQVLDLCVEHRIPAYAMCVFGQDADGCHRGYTGTALGQAHDVPGELLIHATLDGALGAETLTQALAVLTADSSRQERVHNSGE